MLKMINFTICEIHLILKIKGKKKNKGSQQQRDKPEKLERS